MHRLLKLQHRRHTGKVLAHHHTSYRALAVILVLAGGLIVLSQWTLRQTVGADTLYVSAIVPAPVPTDPPIINEPTEGTTFTDPIITVSGNCQIISPPVSVAIYSNGALLGSAPCENDGTFNAQVTLVAGQNTLIARTVTMTGGNGPDSAPVHVTYVPPIPPKPSKPQTPSSGGTSKPATGGSGSTPSGPGEPLAIHGSQSYVVFGPASRATWFGAFSGGSPPYTVTIDWGDGDSDTYRHVKAGDQQFSHQYTEFGSHRITITIEDSNGNKAVATFTALSSFTPPASGAIISSNPPDGTTINPSTLFGIYGGYLLALSVSAMLWLHAHASGYAFAHATTNQQARRAAARKRR